MIHTHTHTHTRAHTQIRCIERLQCVRIGKELLGAKNLWLICPTPIRDTARALAIKATEFHCTKIGAGQRERDRIRKKTIMKERRGKHDRSVTMHPNGPAATTILQGSISKCRNYSEQRK